MSIMELSNLTVVNSLAGVGEPFGVVSDFWSCIFVRVFDPKFVLSEIIISKGTLLCEGHFNELIFLSSFFR